MCKWNLRLLLIVKGNSYKFYKSRLLIDKKRQLWKVHLLFFKSLLILAHFQDWFP